MPLNLYPDARRQIDEDTASQPKVGPPTDDIAGSFFSSLQANAGSLALLRASQNSQQLVHDWLDAFEAKTGYKPDPFVNAIPGDFNYDTLNKAYQTEKTARPGFDLTPPPTREQAWQHAMDIERDLGANSAQFQARGGPLTQFVTAAGAMAAFATDPITILSSGLGGPEAAGIVATAIRQGGLFGAQQLAISTARYPVSTSLDPNYGPGNVLGDAAGAALSGAALGALIPGAAAAWARVRTGSWPQYIKDAGNVVTRQAVNEIGDPNAGRGAGTGGTASFAANGNAAEAAVAAGKPVAPTPDLFTQGTYRPAQVFTSDGKAVGVQYQVVDGSSLITSNRPDLTVNPSYPAELQPRDRTRATSAEQINAIATKLQPDRLGPSGDAATGAPIIGPDGVVESGNGRVLAIMQAYQADGEQAAAYKAFLQKQGFDTEGIENPVLVARRTTPLNPAERASFAASANQAVSMRMSAPEQAAADARLLDQSVLDKLIADKGIDTADNRPFIRAFFSTLPKEERASLVDRAGTLSQEGQRRVQAALLAKAYSDTGLLSRLLESQDSGVKGIGGALTDAAGPWSAMRAAVSRGTIPAGMDLTPDLLSAFKLVETARARGVKLGELISQADMFSNPITPATKALLGLMFRDEDLTKAASRVAVARGLRAYADEAVKNTTDDRLFGEPLTGGDVLGTALKAAGREDLAAGAADALKPEAVAKALADPVTDDAAIHAVEHLIEERAPRRTGLVVARDMPDGSIRVGKPEQVHADLIDPLTRSISPDEMGFVTPDGKFLTREEAFKYVTEESPAIAKKLNPPRPTIRGEDELVAEQYNALFRTPQENSIGAKTFQPSELTIPVSTLDDLGNETITMRPVQQMLDEADAEIAAAKEIEACASGAMPMAAAAAPA